MNMPTLTKVDNVYFENKLYFPLLIKILEKDLINIEQFPFKLRRPYIFKLESALKYLREDLKRTDIYLTRHNMKFIKGMSNEEYTEYTFISSGHEEHLKYSSSQLKEKTEELMCTYLLM